MAILIIRLLITIIIAFLVGRLVSKMKLPSILGWLITGMILGPHAVSLINEELLNAGWYQSMVHILECAVGLMIGTELVWKRIKKSGKSIVITTLTQSLGTFLVVTLVFGIIFWFTDVPLYLAFIFGGIALATAPAPALSIVREFKTSGPVTRTLIPMAALDDIVGCVVFFTTIAVVAGNLSAGDLPVYMIAVVVILPLVIGAVMGLFAGLILKKDRSIPVTLVLLIVTILITSGVGFVFNNMIMPKPVLNFMLIGMAFSAAFSNMMSEERLEQMMNAFNPVLGVAMIIVILNLGAPLDYHLILGAGIFTAVYIVTRAFGKYFGAYFGAAVTKSPKTVKKFLGFTLLPHSGVSLVFTGIAVSVLTGPAPECARIIRGTIAAAAVINEIIAVIMAKKGFEWAGEFDKEAVVPAEAVRTGGHNIVITISRQHGSGGRELGQALSEKLGIPFYDSKRIEQESGVSSNGQNSLENADAHWTGSLLHDLAMGVHRDIPMSDKVFEQQSELICGLADRGACVIVGRCADYVLRERGNVLKVFVYADIESRKYRIANVHKDEAEGKVLDRIQRTDRKRAAYYKFYTKQHFGEAKNYDVCLNSDLLDMDACVAMVEAAYLDCEAAK